MLLLNNCFLHTISRQTSRSYRTRPREHNNNWRWWSNPELFCPRCFLMGMEKARRIHGPTSTDRYTVHTRPSKYFDTYMLSNHGHYVETNAVKNSLVWSRIETIELIIGAKSVNLLSLALFAASLSSSIKLTNTYFTIIFYFTKKIDMPLKDVVAY